MEVAVHDHSDVVGRHSGDGERLVEIAADRLVSLLDLGVAGSDARVEEDQTLRVIDEVAADHDLLARSRVPVVGDGEMAERNSPDAIEWNHGIALYGLVGTRYPKLGSRFGPPRV